MLWRRSQTGTALTLIRHDATEEIARAVPKLWRRLRGTSMLRRTTDMRGYRGNTSDFKFVPQQPELVVVLLLQLDLSLLELVDLVSNHLHLLDLVGNLALNLFGASALVIELGSKRIKELVEAGVRSRLHPTMGIGSPNCVVHGEAASSAAVRQRRTTQR